MTKEHYDLMEAIYSCTWYQCPFFGIGMVALALDVAMIITWIGGGEFWPIYILIGSLIVTLVCAIALYYLERRKAAFRKQINDLCKIAGIGIPPRVSW